MNVLWKRPVRMKKWAPPILAAILLLLLVVGWRPLLVFLYHQRFLTGAPAVLGAESVQTVSRLDFRFSLGDVDFLNSLEQTMTPPEHPWRRVEVETDGKNHPVDITRFQNYFKYMRVSNPAHSFTLRFPKKHPLMGIRSYDVFSLEDVDALEWELTRLLGAELGLLIPRSECIELRLHSIFQGASYMKQSYDEVFLSRSGMEGGIIFTVDKTDAGEWAPQYLFNGSGEFSRFAFNGHIRRFLEMARQEDPRFADKFFDPAYMARFEVLRELLDAGPEFILEDNIIIIYNIHNGLFYPVLDESNVYNRQRGKLSGVFAVVSGQFADHAAIKEKKAMYYRRMGEVLPRLKAQQQRICSWSGGGGAGSGKLQRLRRYLITSFFELNVFPRIEAFSAASVAEQTASPFSGRRPFRSLQPPPRSPLDFYRGSMLADAKTFIRLYPELSLSLVSQNRIIIRSGSHELRRDVIVPRGCVLEILPGATLQLAPGVSFICFSPVRALGRAGAPVVIRGLETGKPFGTFAAYGAGDDVCIFEHVDISGASAAAALGAYSPGGVAVTGAAAEFRFCFFHDNSGPTALAIRGGSATLAENRFVNNRGDDVWLHWGNGSFSGNRFDGLENPGTFSPAGSEAGGGTGGAEPEARGAVRLSHSQVFVSGNTFSFYPGKAFLAGEDSHCLLKGNTFRSCFTAAASRNNARLFIADNFFSQNNRAVRAYMKDGYYGGGIVYLMQNRWEKNDRILKTDKHSTLTTATEPQRMLDLLESSLSGKSPGEWLQAVETFIRDFRGSELKLESFALGGLGAEIDHDNRVIFVSLPNGSAPRQRVTFKITEPGAEAFIQPEIRGPSRREPGDAAVQPLNNGDAYDFGAFIFYGEISVVYEGRKTQYELIVTTGELPVVEIDTTGEQGFVEVVKDEPGIPCKVRVLHGAGENVLSGGYLNRFLDAEIEGRGKRFPKWKYGLRFDSGYGFAGMPQARNWVLESSFVDKSLMRSILANHLLARIISAGSGLAAAQQGRFVEVFLNGAYNGVYILMEHVDRAFLELEGFDPHRLNNALLYRARNENANFSPFNSKPEYKKDYAFLPGGAQPKEKQRDPVWGWRSGFEQRYPDVDRYGEYWRPLEELVRFTALAPEERFQSEIFAKHFNRDNFLDVWLCAQLTDDSDGLTKNRYIARRRGAQAKWFIVPWDKDGVMGRASDMKKRGYDLWLSSFLFDRCWKNPAFRRDFKIRWRELRRQEIISAETAHKEIDRWLELLADAQQRNFRAWPPDFYLYPDSVAFKDEAIYLKKWIQQRIQWLDAFIETIDASASGRAE